ncbi:FecCD family ABC transporter permease [Paenibacillus sp. FSL K6-1230]|uniref:FecCD family ABC transporter permease n=1 Tax=Paenibacillus sp. FSL K6-1230 TaxID=2921603 RepID=UPI00039EFBE7
MNHSLTLKRKLAHCIALTVLLIILVGIAVNLGSIQVTYSELFRGLFIEYNEMVEIIYDLRFPRIIISLLSGAALAVSGVLLQAVMKNPLADPGIIGISSGANLTAVIVIMWFPQLYFLSPLFAFVGGVAACALVFLFSWRGGFQALQIILTGIAIHAVFTGLLDALGYMTGGKQSIVMSMVRSNISMKTWDDVRTLAYYVPPGLLLAFFTIRYCNLLGLEEKVIRNLGVRVASVRLCVSAVAVLLASISTAVAGTMAFVGLIAPHIARLLVGSNHKWLIPFSILLGSFTVLLADTLGRYVARPYEIPASIVMAVLGGPFFIFLLWRKTRR